VLFLIANTGYGGADALNNGYLPQLSTPDERDALSSRGWAIGYLGGFVLLAINLARGHSRGHGREFVRRAFVRRSGPLC
jgi:UMF1 family MFS transporter